MLHEACMQHRWVWAFHRIVAAYRIRITEHVAGPEGAPGAARDKAALSSAPTRGDKYGHQIPGSRSQSEGSHRDDDRRGLRR